VAVSINGCGVDTYSDNQAVAPPPSGSPLQITAAANAISVKKNQTLQLTATETLVGGSPVDRTSEVTWESSDISKATVSTTGLVTGVSVGPFTIKAKLGTLEASISLKVPAGGLY
jgi:uncharacterized protein YjdB